MSETNALLLAYCGWLPNDGPDAGPDDKHTYKTWDPATIAEPDENPVKIKKIEWGVYR